MDLLFLSPFFHHVFLQRDENRIASIHLRMEMYLLLEHVRGLFFYLTAVLDRITVSNIYFLNYFILIHNLFFNHSIQRTLYLIVNNLFSNILLSLKRNILSAYHN